MNDIPPPQPPVAGLTAAAAPTASPPTTLILDAAVSRVGASGLSAAYTIDPGSSPGFTFDSNGAIDPGSGRDAYNVVFVLQGSLVSSGTIAFPIDPTQAFVAAGASSGRDPLVQKCTNPSQSPTTETWQFSNLAVGQSSKPRDRLSFIYGNHISHDPTTGATDCGSASTCQPYPAHRVKLQVVDSAASGAINCVDDDPVFKNRDGQSSGKPPPWLPELGGFILLCAAALGILALARARAQGRRR